MEDFDLLDDPDEVPAPRNRRRKRPAADDNDDESMPRRPSVRVRPDSDGPRRPRRKAPKEPSRSIDIMAFLRDQRLHLGIGIVLCCAALVSVVMCISFMSANVEDQSVTLGRSASEIVENGDFLKNAGNAIGAKVAHLMMVDTLGVGSFIIAFYIFMIGLACMKVIRISFWSLSFRCIFSAVAVSVIVGFVSINRAATFPLGGVHGQYANQWLTDYAGLLGAFGVSVVLAGLLVAVFYYPLKTFFAMMRKVVPGRRVAAESEDTAEDAEENGPTLDQLEQPVGDTRAIGPDECEDIDRESADVVTTPVAVPAASAADEVPTTIVQMPDLSELDSDDGFAIDEPDDSTAAVATVAITTPATAEAAAEAAGVVATVPVEISPATDDTVAEAAEKAETGTVTTIPSAPGEPEMIIRTAEPTAEAPAIADGDHMGLDTIFDPRAEHSSYKFPPIDLLLDRNTGIEIDAEEQAANKQMIVNALRSFSVEIVRIEATIGPTVTLYEIVPAEGIRIARIKSLEDDIAMSLSAPGIRIIAPIPGRGTIGIEVPNRSKQIVPMRHVIESAAFQKARAKMNLPVALGKTISNDVYIADLAKMPHLLVAGATGQGKSVGLNCIITSLLYSKHPDELKFVLVDPKMVEFSLYRNISKPYMAKLAEEDNAIITDPMKVVATLNSLCVEMDRRYELLSEACVRDVVSYNERFTQRRLNPEKGHRFMPYIVMIVDEFADLVTTAGKDISVPIARIAQKGRAAGMHMIIATQRPSTDVITGMIKANFPARIAFRVLSSIDSKTILDRPGAHRLIGMGDMLTFINGGIERVQCAFVDTDEIEAICEHISGQPGFTTTYELPEVPNENEGGTPTVDVNLRNEEFNRCALYIASQTQASITVLQRKFQIGFNKAGRYMDQMEALGIVGPANGAKPREVRMTPDEVQRLISEA